jgi:anti-anti-sigma factor
LNQPHAPRAAFGRIDGTSVLELHGAIRYPVAEALSTVVDDVVGGSDVDAIMVDVRDVDTIDSTGLGVLARIGRRAAERRGLRAVLVCDDGDVAATLRAASFDQIFVMVDHPPFDSSARLTEVRLGQGNGANQTRLGRVVLEAHRDLASVSATNREVYRDVIAALEAELGLPKAPP